MPMRVQLNFTGDDRRFTARSQYRQQQECSWVGQIYSEGRYGKGITRRSHKVGDKTFNEETLPVESATEYFEHFPVLEIDYTFYRLLLRRGRLAEEVVNILTEEGKDLEARFAKVGRNDPRPYGSRKKFKTCHGH